MVYLLLFICIILFILKKNYKFQVINIKQYFLPVFIIFVLFFIVVFSKSSLECAQNSIKLWLNNVMPSLLPFFICIEILKKTNIIEKIGKALNTLMYPIFNVPGSGSFALIMGVTSGYPVGAKVSADLYSQKLCTKIEAERLIAFTNSSGPLFIIGAIGIRNV